MPIACIISGYDSKQRKPKKGEKTHPMIQKQRLHFTGELSYK
jgi:hypothetical protein